jgi:hypothetical protein
MYHVFTDSRDEYFTSYDEAKALFDEWAEEYGCARLYAVVTDEDDGDCIEAVGPYPM